MQATLQRTFGNNASFDLILIDGHEEEHFPTNVQIEDSTEQISLAESLGADLSQPHEEGEHGVAFDFLKSVIDKPFAAPEGYFDAIPYGPFKKCNRCKGFHRLGFGGDCIDERYVWENDKMTLKDRRVSELLVVVPRLTSTNKIVNEIDAKIGYKHNRYYSYPPNKDVVYIIDEEDVEKVGKILDKIEFIIAFTFNDVQAAEPHHCV